MMKTGRYFVLIVLLGTMGAFLTMNHYLPWCWTNIGSQVDESYPPFPNLLTEEEAMAFGNCESLDGVSDPSKSTITFVGDTYEYQLGDSIRVLITMYDHKGKRKLHGGEILNVVMRCDGKETTAILGLIKDKGDGTYEAEIEAAWTGNATISVSLRYTREAQAAIYKMWREMLSTYIQDGVFKSDSHMEATHCHPNQTHLQQITGYSTLCNLTYINSGMPWYCSKPININLMCEDWYAVKHGYTPNVTITQTEKTLLETGPVVLTKTANVYIFGTQGRMIPLPLKPCNQLIRKTLWGRNTITGFYHKGKWVLRNCKEPGQNVVRCLTNKTIYMMGDSTVRNMYLAYFMKKLGCLPTTEKWTTDKLHKPAACFQKELNMRAEFRLHAHPISLAEMVDNTYTTYSIARFIDNIPNNERTFVLIHVFVHISPYHFNVFKTKMTIIRASVENLLKRNPFAEVFIKDPHTYDRDSVEHNVRRNDFAGYLYSNILFDVFKGLHDKVILLNNRDNTETVRFPSLHPSSDMCISMVDQMLALACPE